MSIDTGGRCDTSAGLPMARSIPPAPATRYTAMRLAAPPSRGDSWAGDERAVALARGEHAVGAQQVERRGHGRAADGQLLGEPPLGGNEIPARACRRRSAGATRRPAAG